MAPDEVAAARRASMLRSPALYAAGGRRSRAWLTSLLALLPLPGALAEGAGGAPGGEATAGAAAAAERRESITWHFPNKSVEVEYYILEGILDEEEMNGLIGALPKDFQTRFDYDNRLGWEYPIIRNGTLTPEGEKIKDLTKRLVDDRLLPWARKTFSCKKCGVCYSHVRRYRAEERTQMGAHFDTMAFISVVVELPPTTFQGGFYVQALNASSRVFPTLKPGDAVVHQSRLKHGVEIAPGPGGVRHSWVLWLSDTPAACGTKQRWHLKLAKAGDPFAQYNLAESRDAADEAGLSKAARWYRLSAEQGLPDSMQNLGIALMRGKGVEEDPEEGFHWLRKAAETGELSAMFNIGVSYMKGAGADESLPEAVRWWRRAATQGHAQSQFALATAGAAELPGGAAEAAEWLRQAAEQWHPPAIYLLSQNLNHTDPEGALAWLRKAATLNVGESQLELAGELMHRGDKAEAAAWLGHGAQGNQAVAMFYLGLAYARGDGVERDLALAASWLRRAQVEGHGPAAVALAVLLKARPDLDSFAGMEADAALEFAKDEADKAAAARPKPPKKGKRKKDAAGERLAALASEGYAPRSLALALGPDFARALAAAELEGSVSESQKWFARYLALSA